MSDKKILIIGVVVSMLVIGLGISFAYFTSGVNTTGSGSSVNGETAKLIKVEYDAGNSTINLNNAIPGTTGSKDFSVTITPTDNENSANINQESFWVNGQQVKGTLGVQEYYLNNSKLIFFVIYFCLLSLILFFII